MDYDSINLIMEHLTVRITVSLGCFVLLVILAVVCSLLFMCKNNNRTNTNTAMVCNIKNRKNKFSKNDSLFS